MPKTGLTAKQKMIAYKLANEPFKTQNKIAEELNTTPQYISKCRKSDEFKAYLQQCLDDNWKEAGIKARKQMEQLADQGDFRAIEFICKTNDLNPATKVEGNINHEIVINIIDEEN